MHIRVKTPIYGLSYETLVCKFINGKRSYFKVECNIRQISISVQYTEISFYTIKTCLLFIDTTTYISHKVINCIIIQCLICTSFFTDHINLSITWLFESDTTNLNINFELILHFKRGEKQLIACKLNESKCKTK